MFFGVISAFRNTPSLSMIGAVVEAMFCSWGVYCVIRKQLGLRASRKQLAKMLVNYLTIGNK